jgi:ubiquinone/menaquinone biosynthesis C-methylase UbiE
MKRALLRFVVLACGYALIGNAQEQHPVTKRPIAPVMGVRGADWLTRPERETEERPALALDEIGIVKGSVVADIGAGAGFYTKLLVERVGAQGKVYAEDIQPGMIELLRKRINEPNVIPVLGTETDPKLPASALDLALLVDVYHEFSHPQTMIRKLREALTPDGRLVLLEFRAEDAKLSIRREHKMSVEQVQAEIEPEGFQLMQRSEKLPRQHILIFKKRTL